MKISSRAEHHGENPLRSAEEEGRMLRPSGLAVFACALLVLLPGCGQPPGEVRGVCDAQLIPGPRVAELPDPQPCPGVRVQVRPARGRAAVAEVVTDAQGQFRVQLRPGRYTVTATTH